MYFDSMFYIEKEKVSEDRLKEDLTVFGKGYQNTQKIVRCYKSSGKYWKLPIPYAIAQGWMPLAEDKTPNTITEWPASKFVGRDNQEDVIAKVIAHLLEKRSGCLDAPTGFGKTQVALEIAKRMKQNLLFLAHKDDILKQVETTAKQYFNTECGYIKGAKSQTNKIITLSTMQTMAKRVVDNPDYLSNWGMVLLDELHRSSCNSYVTIMEAINRRYMLGVSATHRRGDGLAPVWDNYIGPVICKGIKKKTLVPTLETPIISSSGIKMSMFFDWQGEVSHTKVLTVISENLFFNQFLAKTIVRLRNEDRKSVV